MHPPRRLTLLTVAYAHSRFPEQRVASFWGSLVTVVFIVTVVSYTGTTSEKSDYEHSTNRSFSTHWTTYRYLRLNDSLYRSPQRRFTQRTPQRTARRDHGHSHDNNDHDRTILLSSNIEMSLQHRTLGWKIHPHTLLVSHIVNKNHDNWVKPLLPGDWEGFRGMAGSWEYNPCH